MGTATMMIIGVLLLAISGVFGATPVPREGDSPLPSKEGGSSKHLIQPPQPDLSDQTGDASFSIPGQKDDNHDNDDNDNVRVDDDHISTTDGFRCQTYGYFPKPGFCREYYYCDHHHLGPDEEPHLLSCPVGQVFSDASQGCVPAIAGSGLPECLPLEPSYDFQSNLFSSSSSSSSSSGEAWLDDSLEAFQILKRNKRLISPINSACAGEMADQAAANDIQTCIYVNNIDFYVRLLMSMTPNNKYYGNQPDFSGIFVNYDRDLLNAKSHSNVWRNGDSVLIGILETFELSRTFEEDFKRKYLINEKRHKYIIENSEEMPIFLQYLSDIEELEETKRHISLSIEQVSKDAVKGYFKMLMNAANNKIAEKKRLLEDYDILTQEMDELAAFLEFVENESRKIQTIVTKTNTSLLIFRNDLENDKDLFERHGRIASESQKTLEQEFNMRIQNIHTAIYQPRERLRSFLPNPKNLNDELIDFSSIMSDLKVASYQINLLLEPITKAFGGVSALNGVFNEIGNKLQEMIDFAATSKSEVQKRNHRFLIYNRMLLLECNWNDVYYKVTTLGECTKYY